MKRNLIPVFIFAIVSMLLVGCRSQKLSEKFDEDAVKEAAHQAIEMFHNGEYEEFCSELLSEDLKEELKAEALEEAANQILSDAGAFESYKSEAIASEKGEDGNDYVVAVVLAKYENQKVTYTITLDEDMKVIGFYLK